MAKVFILGGDGFCGWPTALHLSKHDYEVIIVDNFSRRKIDAELGIQSLTPISSIEKRMGAWYGLRYEELNIAKEYDRFLELLKKEKPDTIVHFAEQRSAPYSMKSSETKRYTVDNNVNATHNVLAAIVESGLDIHLVHLGTMGVYGYKGRIPEGYAEFEGREVIYPPDPGSVYHTTKVLDEYLFYFYNKNNGLRITDLHQGIVWGTDTDETKSHPYLINRFDYDGDYGTVLNRFLVQAAIGYPLTVYGTGNQTRAFIHIRDTVQCVRLAIENPPEDRVKIVNQMTETHSILELARLVYQLTGVEISYLENPRKEAVSNDLIVSRETLQGWRLHPTTLKDGLMQEIMDTVKTYKHLIKISKIPPSSFW